MEFQFPLSLDELQEISGVSEVKELFRRWLGINNMSFSYRFMVRKDKYLYVRCSKCKSFLRFRKAEENYILHSFQTTHRHLPSSRRRSEVLQQFIKQLPMDVDLSTACKLAKMQLNETSSRFYYYFAKMNYTCLKFSQLVQLLDHRQYQIHYQPFQPGSDTLPTLLIAVSPLMKSMYQKYGEVVSADFTFKLIKDRHQTGKSWKVGMLVGNSHSRRIVPFALIIALEESAETYYRLIKSFGNIMGRLPGVIITDESKGALSAIAQLHEEGEFEGAHALDLHHILQNVRKKMKNKAKFSYFPRLAACPNAKNFEILLRQAFEQIDIEDVSILEKFILNSSSYCLSQMNPVFVGFSASTGSNEKLHDMIKSVLPTEKPLVTVIHRVLNLAEKLLERCEVAAIEKNPIQRFYKYSEIKDIRFHVDCKIMMKICEQLSQLITLELKETENKMIIMDMITKEEFEIFDDSNSMYVCECNYSVKTGIICCHLMKACFLKNHRLKPYINRRWLISQQDQQRPKYGQGRPKTTRRKRK